MFTLSQISNSKLQLSTNVTYDIESLLDAAYYAIDCDILLTNGKPLQRPLVWTEFQKQQLIIAMLKRIELPVFSAIVNKNSAGIRTFKIVDGKQRFNAISDFVNNKFSIVVNDKDYSFADFDKQAKLYLLTYSLRFNIFYEYSHNTLSDSEIIKWFDDINFAGTQQDIEHFNTLKSYLDVDKK